MSRLWFGDLLRMTQTFETRNGLLPRRDREGDRQTMMTRKSKSYNTCAYLFSTPKILDQQHLTYFSSNQRDDINNQQPTSPGPPQPHPHLLFPRLEWWRHAPPSPLLRTQGKCRIDVPVTIGEEAVSLSFTGKSDDLGDLTLIHTGKTSWNCKTEKKQVKTSAGKTQNRFRNFLLNLFRNMEPPCHLIVPRLFNNLGCHGPSLGFFPPNWGPLVAQWNGWAKRQRGHIHKTQHKQSNATFLHESLKSPDGSDFWMRTWRFASQCFVAAWPVPHSQFVVFSF